MIHEPHGAAADDNRLLHVLLLAAHCPRPLRAVEIDWQQIARGELYRLEVSDLYAACGAAT